MSADVLRQAASLMRERAEAATASPWVTGAVRDDKKLGTSIDVAGNYKSADPKVNGSRGSAEFVVSAFGWGPIEPNAAHIASWHPAVALAVADLLDREVAAQAKRLADLRSAFGEAGDDYMPPCDPDLLAIAHAYLGEGS